MRLSRSPTVVLLLLLVASLLPDHIVMFCYGATGCCPAHATWLLLAGVGWCLSASHERRDLWQRIERARLLELEEGVREPVVYEEPSERDRRRRERALALHEAEARPRAEAEAEVQGLRSNVRTKILC